MNFFDLPFGTYTDHYELTMAQGYFLSGRYNEKASFDYFYRKNPYDGAYVTFSGLSTMLELLSSFRYAPDDCVHLSEAGFDKSFVDFLSDFTFKGSIEAVREGEVVFPNEPVVRIEGTLLETQLVETLVLNILNFETLIATKANRMRLAAGDRLLMEFGLRRSQGFGGLLASKAAISGGFNSTSNVMAGKLFKVRSSGTMAHSWIQSFDDELEAFRVFADLYPDDCILLVDTYNTLKSGIPNAIKIAEELGKKGKKLNGIRLDSGDLTYLSKKARLMLDKAGLREVKIVASNQLDEFIIQSLLTQGAPIDAFGVGTSLATGKSDAALDGVYKLAWLNGDPTMKFSDNVVKTTLPGRKKIWRFIDSDGLFDCDAISLDDETAFDRIIHPTDPAKQKNISFENKVEEILIPVMRNGKVVIKAQNASETAAYTKKRLQQLPDEHKRFLNPHVYKVGITAKLAQSRESLTNNYLKNPTGLLFNIKAFKHESITSCRCSKRLFTWWGSARTRWQHYNSSY